METFRKILQYVSETGKTIVVSLLAVWLIRTFIVQPFYVRGASMEPNFEDGEYLIINEISYRLEKPARGDVIVFRYPLDPSEYFIKRIIGLPGDTVEVGDGKVQVNGTELDEAYLPEDLFTYGKSKVTLGEKEFYVLGDNRPASSDSRRWGIVPERYIIGKVWVRGWPPKRAGVIQRPDYAL